LQPSNTACIHCRHSAGVDLAGTPATGWHARHRPTPTLEQGPCTMTRLRSLGALALVTVLHWSASFAAAPPDQAPGGAVAAACAEDVKTLCPGVQPGEGRIMACLRPQRARLSEGCRAAPKAQREQRKKDGS